MKNNKDIILQKYFVEKLRPVDIAEELCITKSAITKVIKKDERYLKEKKDRVRQNKTKNREETKDYIKKKRKTEQFKNNVDDLILRNMHNQASMELSKGKKMSNMAYRNWNKSAYSYNAKRKGYEFKKELGRSYDVPGFIKVEV